MASRAQCVGFFTMDGAFSSPLIDSICGYFSWQQAEKLIMTTIWLLKCSSFSPCCSIKVIIYKFHGEVSLMARDLIENVSEPIKNWKHFFISYIFDISKCATNYIISFEVYDGFIGQKILKLWRQESLPFGPNPGWRTLVESEFSWTLFFKMREF